MVGVQGEKWGAVVRYWNWSSQVGGLSAVPAVLPVAGNAGSFTQNYLHLQTLDAEITRYLKTAAATCGSRSAFAMPPSNAARAWWTQTASAPRPG